MISEVLVPDDSYWMARALALAEQAANRGEVPVGAVLVLAGEVIGEGWNQPISSQDPTAHAEIIALRQAALTQKNYRLPQSTLYVTLEPCLMCWGALLHARVTRLVYGAADPKVGTVAWLQDQQPRAQFNHRLECCGGLLADESATLLRNFFQSRR